MENWMTYIMECALCLALLYLPFWGLLRKETFFHFNRYALLAITILSFILPLISIPEISTPLANNEILSIQLEEINVMVSGKALSESISWKTILSAIYLTGLVVCLLYKIYDLIQLLRFIPRGCLWTLKENGIHVHCHVHDIASFSWMNHIVISEKDYEENGNNILLHEQAHIACGHSWDVLWLSLVEAIQWFNPFIWMLSKEIQDIHEYEADLTVLRKGINAKNYQLLLIKKAVGSSSYAFANSFNHSSLKKRITMMLKEKSNPWARAKYVMVLPLAALSVVAFAHPKVSKVSKTFSESKISELWTDPQEKTPDVKAKFPGDEKEAYRFIAKNIKYPALAQEAGVEGRVECLVTIGTDGSIKNVRITKPVNKYLDKEVIRIMNEMPKWEPAQIDGKAVESTIPFGVVFKFDGSNIQSESDTDIIVVGYGPK